MPALNKTTPEPTFVRPDPIPLIALDKVKVLPALVLPIELVLAKRILPLISFAVPFALLSYKAPAPLIPVLFNVKLFAINKPFPVNDKAAPAVTSASPVPSADTLLRLITPALTVVPLL